uniref:Transmembrane protein 14Cb n=1 Tax=Mola mola TaxID=94237 RepID=A0A3Q3XMS5_MOLML
MAVDWVGFGYAVLVSAGGVLGYVKAVYLASSSTSVAAGLVFGLLAAVGAYVVSQNPNNVWLSFGEHVSFGCGTGGVRIWPSSQLLCVPAGCLCPLKLVFFPGTLTLTLSRNVRIQSSAHLPLIPQEIVVTEKTKHI